MLGQSRGAVWAKAGGKLGSAEVHSPWSLGQGAAKGSGKALSPPLAKRGVAFLVSHFPAQTPLGNSGFWAAPLEIWLCVWDGAWEDVSFKKKKPKDIVLQDLSHILSRAGQVRHHYPTYLLALLNPGYMVLGQDFSEPQCPHL